jgi:phosphoesterase RecJ-like protein
VTIADLDGFVDHVKAVRGAEVSAMIVEVERDRHKVSLRAPGDADVETIARGFGGGGHPRAAGYRFQGALIDVVRALQLAVSDALAARRCAGSCPQGG